MTVDTLFLLSTPHFTTENIMPIKKNVVVPSGAQISYHVVRAAVFNKDSPVLRLDVVGYKDEGAYWMGSPSLYSNPMDVPVTATGQNFVRSLEAWLIADSASPLFGGTLANNVNSDPLQAARDKQWAIIKSYRQTAFSEIDMDDTQANVTTAVRAVRERALAAKALIDAAMTEDEVKAVKW